MRFIAGTIQMTSIGFLIGGLIVGFLAGIFWGRQNISVEEQQTSAQVTITEDADFQEVLVEKIPEIVVYDQAAEGDVLVSSIHLYEKSWVAIREDVNGVMGNILGAKRLPEGNHENVSIGLLRAMQPGRIYYAVIYKDNGDNAFDHNFDALIEGSAGPIRASFKTFQ